MVDDYEEIVYPERAGLGTRYPAEEAEPQRQYKSDAYDLVADYVARGYWTVEQGKAALDSIASQIDMYGIQPYTQYRDPDTGELVSRGTFLYEQIVPMQAEREKTRLETEKMAPFEMMKPIIIGMKGSPKWKEKELANLYSKLTGLAMTPQQYSQLRTEIQAGLSPEALKELRAGWDVRADLEDLYGKYAYYQKQGGREGFWEWRELGAPWYPIRPEVARAPSYEPAFEAMVAGVEKPWTSWVESKYYRELGQFKAITPEPTEVGWAEYLRKRKPELKEEWWSKGAYGRRERPAAFQPPIRTVSF